MQGRLLLPALDFPNEEVGPCSMWFRIFPFYTRDEALVLFTVFYSEVIRAITSSDVIGHLLDLDETTRCITHPRRKKFSSNHGIQCGCLPATGSESLKLEVREEYISHPSSPCNCVRALARLATACCFPSILE